VFKRRERDPAREPFGQALLALRDSWEGRIAAHGELEDPNRIVLLSGSAGATVALGGYGSALIAAFAGESASLTNARGNLVPDCIAQFAHALQTRRDAVEAAYRVTTWAMVSEQGAFYWRPNYELEIHHCGGVRVSQ
jgi:hypothetical protein